MTKIQVDSNGKAIMLGGKALVASEGGVTPTGTLSITANGIYDVTNYASANVSVSGGGGTNLLTARYLSTAGVSLSYNSYCYELKTAGNDIYGQYNTILLGTTSDQIATLLSFMRDIYNVKDQGLESLYYSIFFDDSSYTFIPILLPSLNTIEVYDFVSGNLQWTLTLEN